MVSKIQNNIRILIGKILFFENEVPRSNRGECII